MAATTEITSKIGVSVYSGSSAFREREDARGFPLMTFVMVAEDEDDLAERMAHAFNNHEALLSAVELMYERCAVLGMTEDQDAEILETLRRARGEYA